MGELLHDLLVKSASKSPASAAVCVKGNETSYADLLDLSLRFAQLLYNTGIKKGDRVALYLPKQLETIVAVLGISAVGGTFVPINPLLKPDQIKYILNDCSVTLLISGSDRTKMLSETLTDCPDLRFAITVKSANEKLLTVNGLQVLAWDLHNIKPLAQTKIHIADSERVAIIYTSGSSGKPKGVVLSHRNMVTGANSVVSYLNNQASDRILAVLPFSFDYGLSQLTTSLRVGACIVLMEYLFPRDILTILCKERITGLAAVPPLWTQLAKLSWPAEAQTHLRYITSSGGSMPTATINALRSALPTTQIFLMYGLTEAFRSTYLDPLDLDNRPDSIGKAIPNADITVVRSDGSECKPGESGELVHSGPLVALGYWNDPQQTAQRFKPWPVSPTAEGDNIAVWSGDTVKMDSDGFLFFIGRKDDMIKTSGYRISPAEIEEVIHASDAVGHVVVLGIPDIAIGQSIVAVVAPIKTGARVDIDTIISYCKHKLPAYMVPTKIEIIDHMPKTPNGKIDRNALMQKYIK